MHIVRANMAFVWPRVHGDAMRTGLQAQFGRAGDAGYAQVPRVADQGHFIDVDGEVGVVRHGTIRLEPETW